MTFTTLHADFSLRWEGDLYGSETVATTVERNTVLKVYPHYSSKKPACIKGQRAEQAKDTPLSPSLPLLTGIQGRGAEAGGVGVGEVNPKYFTCDELLTSQDCPWHWGKSQQTNRKEK